MKVLLIDGEFYKKIIPEDMNMEELLERAFGIVGYPDRIIYYSANIPKGEKEQLNQVKNLEINEKGYISQCEDNNNIRTRRQKGVDGYIVRDLVKLSWNDDYKIIYAIAGDGDLTAGFEEAEEKNKVVRLITKKNNIASALTNHSKVFYINEIIVKKEEEINENIKNFLELYSHIEEKYGKVNVSNIGINAKKYKFEYKGKLLSGLKKLENLGVISLQKIKDKPDYNVKLVGENL